VHERTAPIERLAPLEIGGTMREELCALLAAVPLFDGFSGQDLRLLTPYLQAYRVPANATIAEEGCAGDHLGIILEGRVAMYRKDGTGTQTLVTDMPAGMTYGAMSLIDALPQTATIIAETDAMLAALDHDSFRRLIDNHAIIGVRLLHRISSLLSQQLREVRGQLVEYLG